MSDLSGEPQEHISCTPLSSTNEAAHSSFETQRRRHQKSETGVSVAPKWTCVHQRMFSKKLCLQQVKFHGKAV